MNRILNYCAMTLLSAAALTMGSCTEEYEYDPAGAVAGAQVYFSSELETTVNLEPGATSFTVPVSRVKTDDALTVNLTLTTADEDKDLFSMPGQVSFAEGESTAEVTVDLNPEIELEYDDFKEVSISVTDADYTTPYGQSVYTFSVGIPAPYKSLGTGHFSDTQLITGYVDVEIMQNEIDPNQFRIMNPYKEIAEMYEDEGYEVYPTDDYLEVTIMQPGNSLSGVTITQSDLVYFSPTPVGIDMTGQGNVTEIWHPVHFGGNYATEEAWTHSRVLAYQENGLPGEIQLAPFYYDPVSGYGNPSTASQDGVIDIVFPGYEITDYSISLSYSGALISAEEESFALGKVTLGEDVAEAKVAVVEGDNADNALNQVLGGAVETVSVKESGDVRVPCNYSGTCTMIAVAYDDEGTLQNYATTTFDFALTPGEWKGIGTGLYTDYAFAPMFLGDQNGNPAPAPTYEVQIQENVNTPGVYRVINPYHPDNYYYQVQGGYGYDESQDYNLIIDAHDPDAVYIQAQPIGIDGGWQDQAQTKPWGTITLFSLGGAYIDAGNPFDAVKGAGLIKGTLKDGVVTFEPKELFMGGTMMEAGTGYYLGVDDVTSSQPVFLPTTVLVLPDAVTAQAKAKAAGAKKQTMVMRQTDKSKFRHVGKKIRKINSLKKVSATKYIRFQRG